MGNVMGSSAMGRPTDVVSDSDRSLEVSPQPTRAQCLANLLQLSRPGGETAPFSRCFSQSQALVSSGMAQSLHERIATLQNQAAARIPELAIPSNRDEAWRFTDLSRLLSTSLTNQPPDGRANQQPDEQRFVPTAIASYVLPGTSRMVFVNGVYAADLSDLGTVSEAITIGNASALASSTSLAESLAKLPDSEEVFTTLNTASFCDIAVISAQRNAVLTQPIHVLFVSAGDSSELGEANRTLSHPRCLVVAETGSSLTLIEEYVSLGDGPSFTNAVTEIVLAENASVNHSRIQRQSAQSFHIGKTAVIQAQDSRYTNIAVQIGGELSRHNLEVHHQGSQVESNLYGLAIASGDQLVDTHSNIQYNEPHCQSDQLYKAIATDKARSVFNGRVHVPQNAQKTNAKQLNRNLLLSNRARIDTKPQLEIVADDVKCTHGATVSQLEDDQVFYLQSRGIDRGQAQKLLIEAFGLEILLKLPSETLRRTLAKRVMQLTGEKI
jgi:Fe-S cluster assembly protein SufD